MILSSSVHLDPLLSIAYKLATLRGRSAMKLRKYLAIVDSELDPDSKVMSTL